jgi:hypothetical protein
VFGQLITGTVTDREGFEHEAARWRDELKPNAIGFVGSTSGVSDEGRFVLAARFESEEAARANSDKPEQGEWWAAMEPHLADVEFLESTDVVIQGDGGSTDAGFVQVMEGRILDADAYDRMMAKMDEMGGFMQEFRPDLLGSITLRAGDRYVDLIAFTTEAEAREGEQKPIPDEMHAQFADMMTAFETERFTDLKSPTIF